MTNTLRLRTFLGQIAFAIVLSACAIERTRPSPPAIFIDASVLAGQRITVTGYLRYEFENRSLYPEKKAVRREVATACLPILVRRDDEAMDRRVASFNGAVVTITGIVDSLTEPGMSAVGTCKDTGLVVESISTSTRGH